MAETFGIRLVHFDQFPMGHPKRKPTTLATNVPEMIQLQDIRGAPTNEAELTNQFRSLPLTKRLDESKKWAAWAPGLKLAIATVIREHVNMLDQERVAQQWAEPALLRPRSESPEQHQEHFSVPQFEPDSVQSRNEPSSVRQQQGPASVQNQIKPTVQALGVVALEQWKKHFLNDHMPARRDCSHCVRAQGRSKPHRRVQHPESYTLSIDLSGKMSEGMDQNAQGVKYMMVGCYTMPISKDRRSLIPVPGQEHEEQDQPLPGVDEDIEGIQMDEEDHVPPDDDVLLEEGEPMEEGDERHVRSAQSMCATWQRLVDEAQNVAVHQITFVEPLKSRAVKHVLPALARMYCRLRSLGLPLYRLHSDRAKEFCSEPVRTWALERDILITMTPGSSFKANGRVEGEMNTIKKSIRTLISAQLSTLQQWPLAARHIGERRLRAQLQLLGWPVGRMLRFGATAYALRKSWQARYVAWRDIREEVKILGPDMNSSLTNTGYYVESKTTGRRFYTDDVVIPEAQQPAVEDQVLYLPERAEDAAPMRRHRTKEKVPAISMMNMEGERVITQRFSDMFDNDPYYVNSSDSWTLGTDDQSSASSSPKRTTDLEEEWWIGVGDVEEAPNNRAGSSYPVASSAAALRALHVNLTNHVGDEMQKLDAVSSDQAWWLGAVSDAIKMRNMVEQRLQDLHEQDAQDQQHNMEQEFLVTRTIGNAEVWADLEAWSPSIKQECDQLVKKKCAVRQITKSQLQQMASELKLPIEILPGKMVHTRKSGTGAYRSRAVSCGNYAGPDNNEHYAGGVDGQQVRTMVRLAALKRWQIGGTDIRTAFLNAPRRDKHRLIAMEIPSVFRRLQLAESQDIWLVDKALYGLTTSPRDWGLHRDEVLPTVKWHRHREGRETFGSFKKTPDENVWRLEEEDKITGEVHWTGLMSVYVDDLLLAAESGALDAAAAAIENVWAISTLEKTGEDQMVKYCGFEIEQAPNEDGYVISQKKYEQEMVQRFGINRTSDFPQVRLSEDDEFPTEGIQPADIKTAQSMAGALLWLTYADQTGHSDGSVCSV